LHEQDALRPELSCTTNMWRVDDTGKNPKFPEPIRGRMGGNFYGRQKDLIKLLKKEFGSLIPMDGDKPLVSSDGKGLDCYFSAIRESKVKALEDKINNQSKNSSSLSTTDQPPEELRNLAKASMDYVYAQFNLITGETEVAAAAPHSPDGNTDDDSFRYDVLPAPPNVTCDMPHPHKITSLFPKDGIDHRKLANQIYDQMAETPFLADVNRYMVWHCLGGAMRSEKFHKQSSFAYRDKPYLLQLQSWWNHAGQLRNDKSHADYTAWVNEFRKELDAKGWTEGAFINFVDRDLVEDISTLEGRLELLQYYYGNNLDRLRAAKTEFDSDNVFDFAMSLLPFKREC
ncbi:MAG: BBE domain-containing protein, partial [Bacteroidota bacterium]